MGAEQEGTAGDEIVTSTLLPLVAEDNQCKEVTSIALSLCRKMQLTVSAKFETKLWKSHAGERACLRFKDCSTSAKGDTQ